MSQFTGQGIWLYKYVHVTFFGFQKMGLAHHDYGSEQIFSKYTSKLITVLVSSYSSVETCVLATCCRKARTSWTVFKTSRCTIIGRVMYHRLCNCQNKTQNRETRKLFTYNYTSQTMPFLEGESGWRAVKHRGWAEVCYGWASNPPLDGERLSDGDCCHGDSPSWLRQVGQLEKDVHFHRGHLAKPLGSDDELLWKTEKEKGFILVWFVWIKY